MFDGCLTRDQDLAYKYDAAGNNVEVRQLDNTVINSQWFDADAQVVKRVEQNVNASPSVTSTYYVRSSVLGGRVVAEVNPAGQKQKRNVYLGSAVLATEEAGGHVSWQHENAVTGSHGESEAGGIYTPLAEYDPSGVNVGMAAPSGGVRHGIELEMPTLIDDGGANDNRCMFNNLLMDCELVGIALANGALSTEDRRRPGRPGSVLELKLNGLGGATVFVADDESIPAGTNLAGTTDSSVTVRPGGGHLELLAGVAAVNQGTTPRVLTEFRRGPNANFTDEEGPRLQKAWNKIVSPECKGWFEAKLAEFKNPDLHSALYQTLDAVLADAMLNKYNTKLTAQDLDTTQMTGKELLTIMITSGSVKRPMLSPWRG